MDVNIETCIKEFDKKIEQAYCHIGKTIEMIDKTDERIRLLLENFRKNFMKIDIAGNNIFEKDLKKIITSYREKCTDWCQAVEEYIKCKEFVDQFERSILVVVFGNVNVGKSSVGNLIAGVVDKKNDSPEKEYAAKRYFGDAPLFYEYDIAGEKDEQGIKENKKNYFQEGYTETTANIQYFTRKQGLTWTDSPGIHSVNKENGKLAKKYVDYADLVIFITTSSSPAKNDEVQELRKLFDKQKPVLILINKSDQIEKDEVNGDIVKKLCPKTKEDRKKQERYICELFQKESDNKFSEIGAISISTYLAWKALEEEDDQKFEDSGIPRFYDKLGELLDEKAVDLKMNAPKIRMNGVIKEIIYGGSLAGNTISGIQEFIKEIESVENEAENCKEKLCSTVKEAKEEIIEEINKQVYSNIQDASKKIRTGNHSIELSDEINEMVMNIVQKVLTKKLSKILSDVELSMSQQVKYLGIENSEIKIKYEECTRQEYDIKTVSREPSGLIEKVVHFFTGKEYTREKVISRTITEKFQNGDNSMEIQSKIQNTIENTLTEYMDAYYKEIINAYFSQEETVLERMKKLFDNLSNELERVKLVC